VLDQHQNELRQRAKPDAALPYNTRGN